VARAGRRSGAMIHVKMPMRPAPSIIPASVSSCGIWRINSVSIKTAIGIPMAVLLIKFHFLENPNGFLYIEGLLL